MLGGSGDVQKLDCIGVGVFGSVGVFEEAEEIKLSVLLSSAFCSVFVSQPLTAVWCYSLFSLSIKCAMQLVRSQDECIINALNFFPMLDHLLFELFSIC